MTKNDFRGETPLNYTEKSLCVLVLDVSESMSWESNGIIPIDELNKGLQDFYNEIADPNNELSECLEVSLITFSNIVRTVQEPALVENISLKTLTTGGSTAMVDAVNDAIDKVQARKDWYKKTNQSYYRPWIILITDGAPNPDQDVNGLASRIKSDMAAKKYVFLPIGVEGADMFVLDKITGCVKDKKIGPIPMQGAQFAQFFVKLSSSFEGAVGNEAANDSEEDDQIKQILDDIESF